MDPDSGDRRRRILEQLSLDGGIPSSMQLCEMTAEIAGVTGGGIMLMSGEVPRGSLCATDDVAQIIEDLQYSLGEGPCVDAYHQDRVVAEPDLADSATSCWFGFTPAAVAAGARALFAFPLSAGTVRLGALDLYRDRPGPLSADQLADALMLAGMTAGWVLEAQRGTVNDSVAQELAADAEFHFAVHNAAGMVSVQLGVSTAEALLRLRGYAFALGRPLADLAADVVAGKLRLR